MAVSFKKQMRILRKTEPTLFESIASIYKRALMEGIDTPYGEDTEEETDLVDKDVQPDLNEPEEIHTKGNTDAMNKLHELAGINTEKKTGDKIYTEKTNPEDVATLSEDQQQLLNGQIPTESTTPALPLQDEEEEIPMGEPQDDLFADEFAEDTEQTEDIPQETTDATQDDVPVATEEEDLEAGGDM